MVDIHDRECRNFQIDQVVGLMTVGVTMPTAFDGFVHSGWVGFHKLSEREG